MFTLLSFFRKLLNFHLKKIKKRFLLHQERSADLFQCSWRCGVWELDQFVSTTLFSKGKRYVVNAHSWAQAPKAALVLECSMEGLTPSDLLTEGGLGSPLWAGHHIHLSRDGFHCLEGKHILEMYGCFCFVFCFQIPSIVKLVF